jgi:hypothetical protein
MRRSLSAVLAAVMAAAVFFSGWGFITLSEARQGGWNPAALAAFIAMTAVGVLLGTLVSARRISPLATGLPGLVLLGWSAVQMFGPVKAYKLSTAVPGALGAGFSQMLLYGMATVLGAVMVSPMLISWRWRPADRHAGGSGLHPLTGLAAAVALAIVLFFAAGWAIEAIAGRVAPGLGRGSGQAMAAFAVLAATGLVLGTLLATRRVSPLATGLPGIVLLGWSALLAFDQSIALRTVPLRGGVFGQGFADILLEGLATLLGAAMITRVAVPSSWRRAAADDGERLPGEVALTT